MCPGNEKWMRNTVQTKVMLAEYRSAGTLVAVLKRKTSAIDRGGGLTSDNTCTALGYHRYDEEGQTTGKTALLRAQARLRQREMDKPKSLVSLAPLTSLMNR
ncbi:hypothetical protein SIAM614_12238 [Stappia aggregata IAM 12614]|uniref:Uncharacterized protein n=2 Tax=Roseibium aggregatum TaxID=187304 RepID=A0NTY5_ROSAI|nr:hypothetical protein SIAM614_12238 [Stappia aggregata IAM 12614] [Roseibium aggregatum IAM 12614]